MGSVSSQWNGDDAMSRLSRGASRGNARALAHLHGHVLAAEPVDTGNMKGSTTFEAAPTTGDEFASGVLTVDTDYAVYVHERTDLKHPTGQDHFVSEPMERLQGELVAIQATEVARAFGN